MQHVWATERTNVQLLITSSITLSSSIPLCSPGPMLQASSGGPDQWSVISDHNHRHLPHQHHQHLVEGALTLYWPGKRGQNSKRERAASLVEKQYSWKGGFLCHLGVNIIWLRPYEFKTASALSWIVLTFRVYVSRVVTAQVISEFTFQDISPAHCLILALPSSYTL